jgi:hypothetical protein
MNTTNNQLYRDQSYSEADIQAADACWFYLRPNRHIRLRRAEPGDGVIGVTGLILVLRLGPTERLRRSAPLAGVPTELLAMLQGDDDEDPILETVLMGIWRACDRPQVVELGKIIRRAVKAHRRR